METQSIENITASSPKFKEPIIILLLESVSQAKSQRQAGRKEGFIYLWGQLLLTEYCATILYQMLQKRAQLILVVREGTLTTSLESFLPSKPASTTVWDHEQLMTLSIIVTGERFGP